MLLISPIDSPAPIIQMVEAAKHSVDVNIYLLTNHDIENALIEVGEHGVPVRIILTAHPFGAERDVAEETRWCQSNARAVTCKFAPPTFTFDHAKYLVVDGTNSEIGTANFTYGAFTKNREYTLLTGTPAVGQALEAVFNADWNNTPLLAGPEKLLVLSPGAADTLTTLINQPGAVDIETEEFGYVEEIFNALAKKGSAVRIIVPDSISTENRGVLTRLASTGAQVRYLHTPYMHAKAILTTSLVFIGSQNFSETSLYKNREVGVILNDAEDVTKLHNQFAQDWQAAQP